MALPRYSGKELTRHLRNLAMEAESLADSGDVVTKAEVLARLLWKKALGSTETKITDDGPKEIVHPPESWAIQMIYERLEGKVAAAAADDGSKISAADRVSDLARKRLNAMVGGPAESKPLPPKLPPKR